MKAFVRTFVERMLRTRTFGLAAEAAFWLFFGLVPLAAVAGLVAARITSKNWTTFAPVVGTLPEESRKLVTEELVHVSSWNGGAVGLTSAALFVWSASCGVQSIFEGLEVEAGEARSWVKRRAWAVVTCLGLSVMAALVALLTTGVQDALGHLGRYLPALAFFDSWRAPGPGVERALRYLVAFGYVSGLYWAGVPRTARRTMPLLPGAAMAVALEALLTSAYTFYLGRLATASPYEAGVALVGLTLTWLYLTAVCILTGAVINHSIGLVRVTRPNA